jgi:hypothetical protein
MTNITSECRLFSTKNGNFGLIKFENEHLKFELPYVLIFRIITIKILSYGKRSRYPKERKKGTNQIFKGKKIGEKSQKGKEIETQWPISFFYFQFVMQRAGVNSSSLFFSKHQLICTEYCSNSKS